MAEGILALLGKAKPKDESSSKEDDSDGEPSSVKARAVRDMFRAADEEDWDAAADAFHRAYVECAKKAQKAEDGDDEAIADELGYEDEE